MRSIDNNKRQEFNAEAVVSRANRVWCGLKQALLLCALIQINLPVFAYSELVIFGDSLSDTGNHYGALIGLPPPYHKNRISNGPVAVDVLAAGLGLSAEPSGHIFGNGDGTNYSVSGANAAGNEPHGLGAQLEAFFDDVPGELDANALYMIMVGGNDVRDASVIDSTTEASAAVVAAIDEIEDTVQSLLQRGARKLLVSNVPDISQIPETDKRALTNPGLHARAKQLSQQFNQGLYQRMLEFVGLPGVQLMQFNFYNHFDHVMKYPAAYGFDNTEEACYDINGSGYHPDCDFDRFVFFDNIHPTAKTHALLGEKLLSLAHPSAASRILPSVMLLLR